MNGTLEKDLALQIYEKKNRLIMDGKAFLVGTSRGHHAFVFASRSARDIERVRWNAVEQRRRFLDQILKPVMDKLTAACPVSAELNGIPGYANGIMSYRSGENGGLSWDWKDEGPRRPDLVLPFIRSWRRIGLLNTRLMFLDDLLSWKMFPLYGQEYGGSDGLTRYVVNGRSYLAKRIRHGYSDFKQQEIYVYSKFAYPGWEEPDVYRTVEL